MHYADALHAVAQIRAPTALSRRAMTARSFSVIDENGGGFILLSEWCDWLKNAERAAKTADGVMLA
eukprot:4228434-Prymnesium_polylepis.1